MTKKSEENNDPILLNNEPADIYSNDLFGTRNKAIAIRDFLDSYYNRLGSNKMFVLYGEWGSGKSSILHYLSTQLSKEKFETVFFETWQNEKDDNLPLSLAYSLAEKAKETQTKGAKEITEFKRASGQILSSFLKGTSVKFGSGFASININGKEVLASIENDEKAKKEKESFSERLQEFKKAFEKLEIEILGQDSEKRLIVFIDDLDRCETENVLALISALKLFFTYAKRTLFVCGVDKKAVMNALKHKYHDTIKAEEYLEKVFDISWTMPRSTYPLGLITNHFPTLDGNEVNFICELFKALEFNNARHVKKVLNKYEMLRLSKEAKSDQSLIPYIIERDGTGDIIATLITLFFITLYEFHNDEFNELEDYDRKRITYPLSIENNLIRQGHGSSVIGNQRPQIRKSIFIDNHHNVTVSQVMQKLALESETTYDRASFVSIFTPQEGYLELTVNARELLSQFSKDHLGVKFCKFIIANREKFKSTEGKYLFWKHFEMCRTLL